MKLANITIQATVEGGKATVDSPLGRALGPIGINIEQILAVINEKTKVYDGHSVSVKVIIQMDTKAFDVEIGSIT